MSRKKVSEKCHIFQYFEKYYNINIKDILWYKTAWKKALSYYLALCVREKQGDLSKSL